MAEQRTRDNAILLAGSGKGKVIGTMELFDSRKWPDDPQAGAGLVRVRIDGRWLDMGGRRAFFNIEGLAALVARELIKRGVMADMDGGRPNLRRGQRVRVWPVPFGPEGREFDMGSGATKTSAMTDPFQGIDGQWRIVCVGCGEVLCDYVEGLDRFGRSMEESHGQ